MGGMEVMKRQIFYAIDDGEAIAISSKATYGSSHDA